MFIHFCEREMGTEGLKWALHGQQRGPYGA